MFQNWAPFLPWRNGHFWKEIGQKLAKNCSKLGSFFALKKWPFLEINWPIIDPKLFKIGLLFLPRKNGRFFFSKLAKNWPGKFQDSQAERFNLRPCSARSQHGQNWLKQQQKMGLNFAANESTWNSIQFKRMKFKIAKISKKNKGRSLVRLGIFWLVLNFLTLSPAQFWLAAL